MRAAFVLAEVLRADPEAAAALERLERAGLTPLVLDPRPNHDGQRRDGFGYPLLACREGDAECWGAEPTLLLDAVRRSGATPSEAFLVCSRFEDVVRGVDAGCRPVLVLGDRTLDEVLGTEEPEHKEAATAPDLATATDFMVAETEVAAELGPFPYAPVPHLEELARAQAPSPGELTRVLAAVVIAGTAAALGIAYLLQELYQAYTFPDEVYWLTLQFIPQAVRGALFLAIGAAAAVAALISIDRLVLRDLRRRRSV